MTESEKLRDIEIVVGLIMIGLTVIGFFWLAM
jgi:hypothetical protein